MKLLVLMLMAAAEVLAQGAAPTGSAAGRVIDADSGAGIPDFGVGNNVKTDARGYYKLTGLKPGPFELRFRNWPDPLSATITVVAGQEVTVPDSRLRLRGEISGRVLDQNKDPISGVPVHVIGREYYVGALRYFGEDTATTNDRGEYVLHNVRAGRAVLLLVEKRKTYSQAVSDAPADPQLRLPAYRATYYPNADSVQGASLVTLRSGEHRSGMDIQMLRAPGYCVDGIVLLNGAPAGMEFKVMDDLTSSANLTPGSGSSGPTGVSTGADGKFRLCDFYPGQFRFTAIRRAGSGIEMFGIASFTIGKEDVHGVRVNAAAAQTVAGEVAWEGSPPDLSTAQFAIITQPVTNDSLPVTGNRPRFAVPGPFSFPALSTVEYLLTPNLGPASAFPGAYVKAISYGVSDILHRPFKATGEGTLRVTYANDGGTIKATAPPGAQVLILPDAAESEAILAAAMGSGFADNTGSFTSRILAPGKYHVIATNDQIDNTPECIGRIWKARGRAQQVEVGPRATATATLELVGLDSATPR